MFSEYASRFLAQSQSRLLSSQTDTQRNPLERRAPTAGNGTSSRAGSKFFTRPAFGSPYGGGSGRFPFSSRTAPPAPLFHSTHDDFREEDDVEEHEREAADLFALQHSRRDFAASRVSDSSDSDEGAPKKQQRRGRGLRSSWTADEPERESRPKSKLVDVDLASTIHEEEFEDDDPPSIQQLRPKTPERDLEADFEARSSEDLPPSLDVSPPEPPRHDAFWGSIFLICIAAVFATYMLVCLHTSPGKRLGDTVYTAINASLHLLAVDTVVAVVVALVWLATLKSFVRPLVFGILVAVPVICFSFSLYPFIASFGGTWHGSSIQDRVMRWFSFVPLAFAVVWTYTAYKGRHSLGRAIELLEFASKILAASPALVLVGFGTLTAVIVWSWIWMLMFTRVFLEGHYTDRFIVDAGTWWLAAFFVLVYLWTLGIAAGVQRAATAATVSQWYFHRLTVPAPSSNRVVAASLEHATTTIFGTICYSTLLALAIRLPLLVLPRRVAGYIAGAAYALVPASISTLTNPLTLSYAAIHSQPLAASARGLSEISEVNRPIHAYRLAKLLLHATRFITALTFGCGGWVSTARRAQLDGSGYRGSLYAYVVGLLAAAIGWAVLGAMEGVLGGILDAVVVCYGSETRGGARYCREAGELLGDGS